jgi:hypothetical protein
LSNFVTIIKFEPIYLGGGVEEEGRERILNSACSHSVRSTPWTALLKSN